MKAQHRGRNPGVPQTMCVLRKSIATAINRLIDRVGFELRRMSAMSNDLPPECNNPPLQFMDETNGIREIADKLSPFTTTIIERIISVCHSVQCVSRKIGGDFVECGVWRTGGMTPRLALVRELDDLCRCKTDFPTSSETRFWTANA